MNAVTTNAATVPQWLDQHIWPQISSMLLNDAYFKLMDHAHELTGQFNGPIGALIVSGYVTSQVIAIRRLCDNRRDVISLRRVLSKAKAGNLAPADQIGTLLSRLDSCNQVCNLANNYIAHTADPTRRPSLGDWNLHVQQITGAQKAISQVAVILDRDLLQRSNHVALIPVPQFDIMQEFRSWVPEDQIDALRTFWRDHNKAVNEWSLHGRKKKWVRANIQDGTQPIRASGCCVATRSKA